jgi:hypothetical protein
MVSKRIRVAIIAHALALVHNAPAAPFAYIGHNTGSGTVNVVDLATRSVVGTIAVGTSKTNARRFSASINPGARGSS